VSRRIVLGPRANGDVGLFIAPPGGDAMTLPDSLLTLNVTSKVSQLVLLGRASSAGIVPLGLSRSPFVFLVRQFNLAGVSGHTLGPGPARPSPQWLAGAVGASASINSNGASMSISLAFIPSTGSLPVVYQVYSQAFT
jgi:hypothetical protein